MALNKQDKSLFFTLFLLIKILFFTLLFGKISDCAHCQTYEYLEGVKVNVRNYTCPNVQDSNPECCDNTQTGKCCPKPRRFYEIDRTLASIIAITVTMSCVVFAIVIALCCFWSKCPLYSACRAEFTHDIATYESKEDSIDMDTMPTEFSIKSHNKFSPVVVSNGNLPLDADDNTM